MHKKCPCQEILTRLQSVEVEQTDPFDDIQEDEEENCSGSQCTVNLEFYYKLNSVLCRRLQNKWVRSIADQRIQTKWIHFARYWLGILLSSMRREWIWLRSTLKPHAGPETIPRHHKTVKDESLWFLSVRALDLMSSYLLGRRQRVKLQGEVSNYSIVKVGVSQGSLLGPLLFNIFINDVNYCIPNISLRLYADDTTTYAADVSPTVLEFTINQDLKILSSWFNNNSLNVNNSKTQAFSVGACKYEYELNMNDTNIEITI